MNNHPGIAQEGVETGPVGGIETQISKRGQFDEKKQKEQVYQAVEVASLLNKFSLR